MRDLRSAPFCWQSCLALAAIRRRWRGQERTTALAVYQALTEIANEARSDRFELTREAVAARAGASPRSLDKYASGLEDLGLLRRTRRRGDRANLPNEWELLDGLGEQGAMAAHSATAAGGDSAMIAPYTQESKDETEGRDVQEASRPEIEWLCELMASLSNERTDPEGRRAEPKYRVTSTWLMDMRRLVDIDGRDPEEVERALWWIHGHDFWAPNILSPRTLRKQYDTIRLQAERDQAQRPSRRPGGERADRVQQNVENLRQAADEARRRGL